MTGLLAAWVLFPLLLGALCAGSGLAVARATGVAIPASLVGAVGFAAIVVVGQFLTLFDATAELAAPVAVALALAGFGASWPWRPRLEPWAVAAVLGAFAVYAAPIALSGQATFAGFIKLDDTATWMALTDRIMEHGRSLAGLAPSSYEATLAFNLGAGYPVGVFLPLGIGRALAGQDVAWVIQPYLAFCAALLTLSAWRLAASVVTARALRAIVAFLAAQPALLVGYYLWGGIKEVAAAALVAASAGLAGLAAARGFSPRALAPLVIVAAALVGVLSGGGVIWLAPVLLATAVAAGRAIGPRPAAWRAVGFAIALAALSIPVLAPGGFLPPTSAPLTSPSALGNLLHPLDGLQLAGVWPSGDFRAGPVSPGLAYPLIGIVVAAAIAGLYAGWRARAWPLLAYVGGALASCGAIVAFGSPWVGGKAMATAAPAIPLAGAVGAGWLCARGSRVAGVAALAAIAAGFLWSNFLAYRDVNLAPRDQLAELQTIGDLVAGRGPTLMTEYEPYGVRHFLRDAAPEGASELRRRLDPLRGGGTLPKGASADTDSFRTSALLAYRTLVLRRSPAQSRPPAPYRLVWRGRYYEAWQRPPAAGGQVIAHAGLGTSTDPAAVPSCRRVRRLARRAGPGGELAAVPRPPVVAVDLAHASHPAAWGPPGPGGRLRPVTPGETRAGVEVPAAGRWAVWLRGSVRPRVQLLVDGRPAGEVRGQLLNSGGYVLLGRPRLAAGAHRLTVRFGGADLHPGSGGAPAAIGPIVLSRGDAAGAPIMHFSPARATGLCGRRWDWIEALGAASALGAAGVPPARPAPG